MSESLDIAFFLVLAVATSVGFHCLIKSYLFASVWSAVAATLALQLVDYFEAGSLDPFFLVAAIISWLVALGISLLIGLPFVLCRRRRPLSPSPSTQDTDEC